MLFAILALLAAQALAAPSNGPIHIPLVRHDRTLVKRAAYQQNLGGVQSDSGLGLAFPIQLGTPAQDLSVLLSMGSASGLTMFGCNECEDAPFYQPNRSSTWSQRENVGGPFDVAYDTVGITGQTVPNAACAYANSTYATKQFGPETGQAGILSLGLGMNVNEKVGAVVPALSGLWDEPVFGVHIRSASGGGSSSRKRAPAASGQITFGGVDSRLFKGIFQLINTINSKSWNFPAQALKVNSERVVIKHYLDSAHAAMAQAQYKALRQRVGLRRSPAPQDGSDGSDGHSDDDDEQRDVVIRPEIGSEAIHLAPGIAEALFASIPGSQRVTAAERSDDEANAAKVVEASTGLPSAPGYRYSVPCNTTATIGISLNGTDFPIPASMWVVPNPAGSGSGSTANTQCQTKVTVPSEEGFGHELYDVLVGTTFLENVYSMFKYDKHQPQIGFAQLADNIANVDIGTAPGASNSAAGPAPTIGPVSGAPGDAGRGSAVAVAAVAFAVAAAIL